MSNDVESALKTASEIVSLVAVVPGHIGTVAKIATLALKAGSAFARAGKDPVIEITRILSSKDEIEGAHDDWTDYLNRNWPLASTAPPPPPDTEPAGPVDEQDDPYDEDEGD